MVEAMAKTPPAMAQSLVRKCVTGTRVEAISTCCPKRKEDG
jgi:hypothetical protein